MGNGGSLPYRFMDRGYRPFHSNDFVIAGSCNAASPLVSPVVDNHSQRLTAATVDAKE
jgi:hypothetical protein